MKSTRELRTFLIEQMSGVAEGKIQPDVAKGVTNIAQQIYNSLLIEIKIAKARADLDVETIAPVRFDD